MCPHLKLLLQCYENKLYSYVTVGSRHKIYSIHFRHLSCVLPYRNIFNCYHNVLLNMTLNYNNLRRTKNKLVKYTFKVRLTNSRLTLYWILAPQKYVTCCALFLLNVKPLYTILRWHDLPYVKIMIGRILSSMLLRDSKILIINVTVMQLLNLNFTTKAHKTKFYSKCMMCNSNNHQTILNAQCYAQIPLILIRLVIKLLLAAIPVWFYGSQLINYQQRWYLHCHYSESVLINLIISYTSSLCI